MILFVLVTCCIGIAAAAAADDKDQDKESLGVSEGENLTISIHIKKSDEDPQVLVTRLKGTSEESIAQLFCHNEDCALKYWESGVSLIYDGGNVTLILMNVRYNQTGLYTVCKLSETPQENKIYNVTVHQAPLITISPSVMYSKSFTVGITSAALVFIILVLITGAIGVVYWKRKANFYKVSQNDDTAASSLCGSMTVIDI